jgi:hypothetical protein
MASISPEFADKSETGPRPDEKESSSFHAKQEFEHPPACKARSGGFYRIGAHQFNAQNT